MAKTDRRVAADEIIFREGEPSDAAYIISAGRIELYKNGEKGKVWLAELTPGEMFGEMGILDQSPRSATARAMEDSTIQVISRDEFLKTVRAEPDVALDVMQRMATRLRGTDDMLVSGQKPAEPAAGSEDIGLIDRFLASFKRAKLTKLDIRIADVPEGFIGGETEALFKRLMSAFDKRKGISVSPLGFVVAMDHKSSQDTEIAAAYTSARHGLSTTGADLVIWVDCPSPGATLYLRFVTAGDGDTDQPGSFMPATALTLPVAFEAPLDDFLVAISLAAIRVSTVDKAALLDSLLARSGEEAAAVIANLPDGLTSKEKGAMHLCYANLVETMALTLSLSDLHSLAAKHYKEALGLLSDKDTPLSWALAKKHLAALQFAAGERSQDNALFEECLAQSRDAMTIFTKMDFPLLWADLQVRAGQAMYRLDDKEDQGDMLKYAIAAYQSALQVYTKANHPDRWADTMHNLAQAAQILGGQLRSQEALEKAIEACEGALTIRDRLTDPMKWAGIQNTLGSAMFMLAKQAKSWDAMEEAATAFSSAQSVYAEKGAKRLAMVAEKNLLHAERILAKKPGGELPNASWEDPSKV